MMAPSASGRAGRYRASPANSRAALQAPGSRRAKLPRWKTRRIPPFSARQPKNCQTLPAAPINAAEPIARLAPQHQLAAMRWRAGPTRARQAATNDVVPLRTPDQISIAVSLWTPTPAGTAQDRRYLELATVITNWMPTIAHSVYCQSDAAPLASPSADRVGVGLGAVPGSAIPLNPVAVQYAPAVGIEMRSGGGHHPAEEDMR